MKTQKISRARYEQAKANALRHGGACCASCQYVIALWEEHAPAFRQRFPGEEPAYMLDGPQTVEVVGYPPSSRRRPPAQPKPFRFPEPSRN